MILLYYSSTRCYMVVVFLNEIKPGGFVMSESAHSLPVSLQASCNGHGFPSRSHFLVPALHSKGKKPSSVIPSSADSEVSTWPLKHLRLTNAFSPELHSMGVGRKRYAGSCIFVNSSNVHSWPKISSMWHGGKSFVKISISVV